MKSMRQTASPKNYYDLPKRIYKTQPRIQQRKFCGELVVAYQQPSEAASNNQTVNCSDQRVAKT